MFKTTAAFKMSLQRLQLLEKSLFKLTFLITFIIFFNENNI